MSVLFENASICEVDFGLAIEPTLAAPPAITLNGAAAISGADYTQTVTFPVPAAGLTWWAGVEGERPAPYQPGTWQVPAGRIGASQHVLVAYLVDEDGAVSPQIAVRANVPTPDALAISGQLRAVSTHKAYGALTTEWPTVDAGIPASPNIERLEVYANAAATDPESTVARASIAASIPVGWVGKQYRLYAAYDDPALGLREFATPRYTVLAATNTAALTTGNTSVLRSEYNPANQTTTFIPFFASTGITRPALVEWTADATTGTPTWRPCGYDAATDEWFPQSATATGADHLFRGTEARNSRLRFRIRDTAAAPWSAESPLFVVPQPTADDVPKTLTSTDVIIQPGVYDPVGQTQTARTRMTLPGIPAGSEVQYKFSTDANAPWGTVGLVDGSTSVFQVNNFTDPDFPSFQPWLIVAGQNTRNSNLQIRWRRTNATGFSAAAVFTARFPNASSNFPADPTPDYIALTNAEFDSALSAATVGQSIAVGPAVDRTITTRYQKAATETETHVHIFPSNRNSPPTLGGVRATEMQGLWFDQINFVGTNDEFGFPSGNGVRCDNGERLRFTDCRFHNFFFGAFNNASTDYWFEHCLFEGIGCDAISWISSTAGRRHTNPRVLNCRIRNPRVDIYRSDQSPFRVQDGWPLSFTAEGRSYTNITDDARDQRHPDGVQMGVFNQANGSLNFRFENNWISTFRGYQHGTYLVADRIISGATSDLNGHHQNAILRGNLIEGNHTNGLAFGGHKNVLVEGNWVRYVDPDNTSWPTAPVSSLTGVQWVRLNIYGNTNTGIVRNNKAAGSNFAFTGSGSLAGLTTSGNVFNDRHEEGPDGWVQPVTGPRFGSFATSE